MKSFRGVIYMNRIYELEYYKEEHNEELRLIKEIIQKVNKKNKY